MQGAVNLQYLTPEYTLIHLREAIYTDSLRILEAPENDPLRISFSCIYGCDVISLENLATHNNSQEHLENISNGSLKWTIRHITDTRTCGLCMSEVCIAYICPTCTSRRCVGCTFFSKYSWGTSCALCATVGVTQQNTNTIWNITNEFEECGICLTDQDTFYKCDTCSNLHCNGCYNTINNHRRIRSRCCPYCRASYETFEPNINSIIDS